MLAIRDAAALSQRDRFEFEGSDDAAWRRWDGRRRAIHAPTGGAEALESSVAYRSSTHSTDGGTMTDPRTIALELIDPSRQVGIEIGALDRPIVTPDAGKVFYVDHLGTAGLREKYSERPNVDVEKIVDIDFVWDDRAFDEVVRSVSPVDYIVASHVIEHVPDMLGWLRQVHAVLRDGGILALLIPDRRFTFDYKRRTTETCDVIDAFLEESRVPSPGQVFDHFSNAVEIDRDIAWDSSVDADECPRRFPIEFALDVSRRAAGGAYCDVHAWVFTPWSFLEVIEQLASLDLLGFNVASIKPPSAPSIEFYVALQRVAEGANDRGQQQMQSIADAYASLARAAEERDQHARTVLPDRAEYQRVVGQLARQQEALTRLQSQLVERERRIDDLLASSSWRLTAPVRWLGNRLHR